jgi:hypothetical protein
MSAGQISNLQQRPCLVTAVLPNSGRMLLGGIRNKEDNLRERMAYLIMLAMLILLVTFILAVLGKGEWQAPTRQDQEKASISQDLLL